MILVKIMEITAKEKEIFANICNHLAESEKTLFFFHDDPDGICSFLQMNKQVKKSYGVIVKSKPILGKNFFNKIDSYRPDLVVTLDLAIVKQEFVDHCNELGIKLIIIDHHEINDIKDFTIYYNPKMFRPKDVTANSSLCYYILNQPKELMWLAGIGTVADWQLPDYYDELKEEYPDLTNSFSINELASICDYDKDKLKVLEDALFNIDYDKATVEFLLFNTKLGLISKTLSFCIKGDMRQVKRSIASLMKINEYTELLKHSSPPAKLIYRRFSKFVAKYLDLLLEALKNQDDSNLLLFTYQAKDSFSGELANELYYLFPDKFVIVARLKDEVYRISMRYKGNALSIFKKSIEDLDGTGGGHEHACGASIHEKDFNTFLERVKNELQ